MHTLPGQTRKLKYENRFARALASTVFYRSRVSFSSDFTLVYERPKGNHKRADSEEESIVGRFLHVFVSTTRRGFPSVKWNKRKTSSVIDVIADRLVYDLVAVEALLSISAVDMNFSCGRPLLTFYIPTCHLSV